IETAIDEDFQAEFVAAMHMPHKNDTFPHLAARGLLPNGESTHRRRARRRANGIEIQASAKSHEEHP
ncbi:MAG TPA: hypothetical protein PKC19_09355, partial [Roseiflexaceae bacterium]|nr:hypothetical protein [Roseiflexaceae bacterium]